MKKNIIIVAEHFGGNLRPVTFELFAFAAQLGAADSHSIKAVIIGDNIEEHAEEIAGTSGIDVIAYRVTGINTYNSDTYKSVLETIAADLNPSYICIPHTSQGMDFAPALAVRLESACISGVNGLSSDKNGVYFSRAIFNGKIDLKIRSETETTVLTVQPGIFKHEKSGIPEPGNIITETLSPEPGRIRNIETKTTHVDRSRLTDARIIVAAGRGIREKNNLGHIRRFAELFPDSAVAGSRPLIDMGWLEHSRQVGLTGATVSPELYIACGISGSSQHIAGMKGARFIVAINSDPNTAIFNISDICIVEETLPFIDAFIKTAQK